MSNIDIKKLTKDARLAALFGDEEKFEEIQKRVIVNENPIDCYIFARDAGKKANVEALQQIVEESKLSTLCYLFAKYVKRANTSKLLDVVIANNDAEVCWKFLRSIKNADSVKISKALAGMVTSSSKSARYNVANWLLKKEKKNKDGRTNREIFYDEYVQKYSNVDRKEIKPIPYEEVCLDLFN